MLRQASISLPCHCPAISICIIWNDALCGAAIASNETFYIFEEKKKLIETSVPPQQCRTGQWDSYEQINPELTITLTAIDSQIAIVTVFRLFLHAPPAPHASETIFARSVSGYKIEITKNKWHSRSLLDSRQPAAHGSFYSFFLHFFFFFLVFQIQRNRRMCGAN